ncbi:type I-E CRISPR-associated endoribonuclease Cas2e [Acidithiobacillus thiooxidans]|nr:type I-E CRISPR-associated endoribonuclease Cas2e [Acidithiobacillus thiooxidans]
MKLWFVEPRPNVFVSGVNDAVAKKIISYLYEHCPCSSGLIIFNKTREAPGYRISGFGDPKRPLMEISGLQLIAEKQGEASDHEEGSSDGK